MNQLESLCRLASEEKWCWDLYCSTCGHLHFRYAFAELAQGKSPDQSGWLIHRRRTSFSKQLGGIPWKYTDEQKESILRVCARASIATISTTCRFPDWLGYLGLVIEHMRSDSEAYRALSVGWANQLMGLLSESDEASARIGSVAVGERLLDLGDLEYCEMELLRSRHAGTTALGDQ